MREKEKLILFEMVYRNLVSSIVLPRGHSKSPITILTQCFYEAIRRTEYILKSVDEQLDVELIREKYMQYYERGEDS